VSGDAAWMAWVKSSADGADQLLTVCTGAFIAGKLGLLDGLDVTTYYRAVPNLTESFPKAHVQPGRRFIDNGHVITTAGVSAGIDGSLHLVARLLGRYVADRTAEYMEYAWTPQAYTASKYAQLNPTLDAHDRELQQATIAEHEGNVENALAIYRRLIAADRGDAEAWLNSGRVLHGQKKFAEAIAADIEAARGSAQRPTALFNLACAYALSGDATRSIETAEKAIQAGFTTKDYWLTDADLASVRNDPRFKALLTSL
jgi:tetratricopeptide (TPR) repeat protein